MGKKEDKLGIRASSTCELILDDCRVPAANVIGEVGKGYKIAIETLNEGRIAIGAQMTGLAQGALDHAIAYAKQRKQFGKPIAEFQGVQFELAQMATEVEAARLLVYNAARLRDAGLPFVTEAAMAKYFASQVGREHRLARRRDPRRRRIHQGLSGGEAISRRQDRPDLRRHQQHAEADHREANSELKPKRYTDKWNLAIPAIVEAGEETMRLVAFFAILAGAAFGATIAHDPSPSEIDDIIPIRRQGSRLPAGAQQLYLSPERQRDVA